MKIILNGKQTEIQDACTLQSLLAEMQMPPERVACELNFEIIKRKFYDQTALKEGDQLEILQMIGGG